MLFLDYILSCIISPTHRQMTLLFLLYHLRPPVMCPAVCLYTVVPLRPAHTLNILRSGCKRHQFPPKIGLIALQPKKRENISTI